MNEFEEWLVNLDAETLTDELKDEILERVKELEEYTHDEAYLEGKEQAKFEIIEQIKNI